MSATTYTITPTSASGIDRCPQPVAIQLDASGSSVITLVCSGGDLSTNTVTFSSSAAAQSINVTPHLGINGGTVSITGTNSTSLTDPAAATITLTAKPKRQRGLRGAVNDVAF